MFWKAISYDIEFVLVWVQWTMRRWYKCLSISQNQIITKFFLFFRKFWASCFQSIISNSIQFLFCILDFDIRSISNNVRFCNKGHIFMRVLWIFLRCWIWIGGDYFGTNRSVYVWISDHFICFIIAWWLTPTLTKI